MRLLPRWRPARIAFAAFVAIGVFFFLPSLATASASLTMAVLNILAFVVGIVLVPLFATWLLGFAYWFIKPYYRAWHIQRIRNGRLFKEAIARGNTRK